MAKITYDNKVALNEEPSIAAINKVSDDDMNEIKTSVNDLYDDVSTNTTDIGINSTDISNLNTYVKSTVNATGGDWNTISTDNGLYMGSGMSNSPTGDTTSPNWWYVAQFSHNTNYIRQLAFSFNRENPTIYSRSKQGGTWGSWYAIKTDPTMYINPTNPSTASWTRVCKIYFTTHEQGEFCSIRLYLASGQNGNTNQNAYMDVIMQLGWTGSNEGRAGVIAVLHPLTTNLTTSNVNVKVIANNNREYYLWFYTSLSYCRVNYTANGTSNVSITPYFTNQSTEPTGTACNSAVITE